MRALLTSACDLVSLSGESKAARITWKSPMSGKDALGATEVLYGPRVRGLKYFSPFHGNL